MPRIPLPVKLLLSYLCVLLIGAGPTFLYIRAVVLEDLMTDAALHIIATRGIAALTTRSLADEVGLTSGAIFKHFQSLDVLLEAVVARANRPL